MSQLNVSVKLCVAAQISCKIAGTDKGPNITKRRIFEVRRRKRKLCYSVFSQVSNRRGNFILLVLLPGAVNTGSISKGGCCLYRQSRGGSSLPSLRKCRKDICKMMKDTIPNIL